MDIPLRVSLPLCRSSAQAYIISISGQDTAARVRTVRHGKLHPPGMSGHIAKPFEPHMPAAELYHRIHVQ